MEQREGIVTGNGKPGDCAWDHFPFARRSTEKKEIAHLWKEIWLRFNGKLNEMKWKGYNAVLGTKYRYIEPRVLTGNLPYNFK
jgi:hypothetical protein